MPRLSGTTRETLISGTIAVGMIVWCVGLHLEIRWLQRIGVMPIALFMIYVVVVAVVLSALTVWRSIRRRSE